jgi:hypothetical protein
MSNLTFLRLRPMLRLLPRSSRSDRHRVHPCDLPAVQTLSTPLDRGSIVIPCAVCIEAGCATEATYQTKDLLCGCDQHIQQLEQHGRTAVRLARRAAFWTIWWPSIGATPAGRALPMPPHREEFGDPASIDRPPRPLADDHRRGADAPPLPTTRRRRSAGNRRSGRARSGES